MQNPRLTPARVEVQGSSHQATVWGQPYRYRLPGQKGSVKIICHGSSYLRLGVCSLPALPSSH